MESKIAETFEELGLSPIMMRALAKLGYERPLPHPVASHSLGARGLRSNRPSPPEQEKRPLLLSRSWNNSIHFDFVPRHRPWSWYTTRELAAQVHGEFVKLAEGCPTSTLEVAGGKHFDRQTRKLREGVQVVVGTPGRVIDHIQRGSLDLRRLWCVVLDEADRMLDIGFRPDIERILRKCPENRQTLLLSATLAPDVKELANRYLFEPVHIDCSNKDISVDTIEQRYLTVAPEKKARDTTGIA